MLAAGSAPLPVGEAADRLRVSRRTVFRELAGLGGVLDGYGLEVGSRPGEGIVLEGLPQARDALLADLARMDADDPADKQDRRGRLFLDILKNPDQKLAVHADRFRVSAATISHDLDGIGEWLDGRGLRLVRKAGSGVFVEGGEMALRRAVLSLMHAMEDRPGAYPHPDILLDIQDLSPELEPLLGWMTPQSRDAFLKYAAVAVQRVMDGHVPEDVPARAGAGFSDAAAKVAVVLSEAFNIRFPGAERAALEVELAACRPNIAGALRSRGENDAALALLAGEMAALFDPDRAALLRMDEVLIEGLVRHLRTAVVRIRNRIELPDPMLDQIARKYPDVLRRSRNACEALRGSCGDWLPESEVSFFAAHFAAALLRLSEQNGRRVARVGVICVYGIGSSYLLASQVKRIFGGRVFVEVGWHGDRGAWRQHDLLVSTTPLPGAPLPVVVVPPILADADAARVGEALDALRHAPDTEEYVRGGGNFAGELRTVEHLFADARGILERFVLHPLRDGDGDFFRAAGLVFGAGGSCSGSDSAAIARDLAAREAVATQNIPELGILLLHCRTEGVEAPVFGVLRSPPGRVNGGARGGVSGEAAVVMLLPSSAPRETAEMMGSFSAALVERESFLRAAREGAEDEIRRHLESILGEFLFRFTTHILKG